MAKEPWTWLSQILCQTRTPQLLPQATRVRQSITWGEERPTISPRLLASSDLALHRQQSKMMTRFCRSISTRWTQKLYSKERQTLRSPRITRVKLQGSSSSCQLKASSLRALKAELWAFKSSNSSSYQSSGSFCRQWATCTIAKLCTVTSGLRPSKSLKLSFNHMIWEFSSSLCIRLSSLKARLKDSTTI